MKEPQILSTFHELAGDPAELAASARVSPAAQVFDACRAGVILRAVLFVELVLCVGAMFNTGNFVDWLALCAVLTGGALPATLTWLIVACSLKRPLALLPEAGQITAGVVLGALAGLYGCAMLALLGVADPAPWLASAAAGALVSALVVAGLLLRARARTPAATTARLDELQARIQPHFLFNTLNSAIALVRAEPAKAESLLEDLSDLFRHALVDQGETVSVAHEVALARQYLSIEQVRFGDRLQVRWDLDPAAGDTLVPPLLLQPLVENAVRHGVEPSPTGADVQISTERRKGTVVIKVTNTVPGGPGPKGQGLALANVRERLKLQHDVQGQFQAAFKDGLFRVRIEVPV